jgi:hypothetical protein
LNVAEQLSRVRFVLFDVPEYLYQKPTLDEKMQGTAVRLSSAAGLTCSSGMLYIFDLEDGRPFNIQKDNVCSAFSEHYKCKRIVRQRTQVKVFAAHVL